MPSKEMQKILQEIAEAQARYEEKKKEFGISEPGTPVTKRIGPLAAEKPELNPNYTDEGPNA